MKLSLREKLASLEQSTGRVRDLPIVKEQAPVTSGQDSCEFEGVLESSLRALGFRREDRMSGGAFESYWRRTLRYDVLTRHGNFRFVDLIDADLDPLFRAGKRRGYELGDTSHLISRLRFYDTETSGLGTGAGTFPFLHAVAYFSEDELILDQYFLSNHTGEGWLLENLFTNHFAGNGVVVVSFNGKSFDWPLVTSRLVMHRLNVNAASPFQLDLLHPSRRLWKSKLGRVSLGELERGVLGLVRLDDVPGSEAPRRYFEFVETGDAQDLGPVMDHNAMDVCSVVSLTTLLARVLSRNYDVDSAREYLALAKWHDEWGLTDVATTCYRAANECPDSDYRSLWDEGLHHKRLLRYEEASRVWEKMADRFPLSVPPVVELAKLAEHQTKRLDEARRWVEEALSRAYQARRRNRFVSAGTGFDARFDAQPARFVEDSDPEIEALRYRMARIQRKLDLRREAKMGGQDEHA